MIKKVQLGQFCFARSGGKSTDTNVGIWTGSEAGYAILQKELTPARVKDRFKQICGGEVSRYDLPNLRAVNFILGDSLDGGGSAIHRTDAQGKTHGGGLLMEVEVPAYQVRTSSGRRLRRGLRPRSGAILRRQSFSYPYRVAGVRGRPFTSRSRSHPSK